MVHSMDQTQHEAGGTAMQDGFRITRSFGRPVLWYAAGLLAAIAVFTALQSARTLGDKAVSAAIQTNSIRNHMTPFERNGTSPAKTLSVTAVAQYALWVTEDAGSRGLFMDCVLRESMDNRAMHTLSLKIFNEVNGCLYGQITIRWHLQNDYNIDAPWAESYITKGRAVHRLLPSRWSS